MTIEDEARIILSRIRALKKELTKVYLQLKSVQKQCPHNDNKLISKDHQAYMQCIVCERQVSAVKGIDY